MAVDQSRRGEAVDQLVAAGHPIEGMNDRGALLFSRSATAPQMAAANAALAALNLAKRRPKGHAALIASIEALSASDRNKLLALMAADFLRRNPTAAALVNLAIVGDEDDV